MVHRNPVRSWKGPRAALALVLSLHILMASVA